MCNFRTLCLFFYIQFDVEMFSNFDVVFLHYNYFTELASLIAYILGIFQPNPLKFSDSPQDCSACYSVHWQGGCYITIFLQDIGAQTDNTEYKF